MANYDYDPAERLEKGKRLNTERQYHEAIDAFEDAILAEYKTDEAYYGLSVAYNALGRGIEAQEALKRSRPSAYNDPNSKTCAKCGGQCALQTEYPNKGAGYIVLVLGIIFTTFCVGLIVVYYGWKMINDQKQYWHCKNCGTQFPI